MVYLQTTYKLCFGEGILNILNHVKMSVSQQKLFNYEYKIAIK
jgi:hypothetical protein